MIGMGVHEFKKLAKNHLFVLFSWFGGFFGLTIVSFAIRDWAERSYGWETQVVSSLFSLVGGLAGLCALLFAVLIYGWFKEYNVALSEAPHRSVEKMHQLRSGVVGPVRWR